MRRSFFGLGARARPAPPRDLRGLRDEHVSRAKETVFGPQGNMPGDRYLRKKLEGRQMMRWYFPSKYNLQDFRNDEYFEMQAERFAPRPAHRCMAALNATAQKVASNREELRRFFQRIDEETFLNTPTVQDLYGVFRMVDPDPVLSFPVPDNIFLEHTPLWGASPPFRYPSQQLESTGVDEQVVEESEESAVSVGSQEEMPQELLALWALISERLTEGTGGSSRANALDARVNRVQTEMEVRELLREEAQQLGIVAPFEDSSVVVEEGRLAAYLTRAESGGSQEERAASKKRAEDELTNMRTKGDRPVREYLARRHRFVDPMFRRRRLKWLERQMAGKNKATEMKFNEYYATHPDNHKDWPTNKGSVTVVWPSPMH